MSRYANFTENLFEIYEEVTGLNLAAIFSAKSQANGQAIKKLLEAYPEEKDKEIFQSWQNFLN